MAACKGGDLFEMEEDGQLYPASSPRPAPGVVN